MTIYSAVLKVVAGLGRDGAAGGPDRRRMIPPALMEQGAYGMNQTVINTVFPRLVPLVAVQSRGGG